MLEPGKIREFAEAKLEGTDLYVVDMKATPSNVIELLIDSDASVAIEDCVELSRAINEAFDREVDDYELTVASSGIGQPLKVLRQYRKLIGKPVEVMLDGGTKILAELREADEQGIKLAYTEKVAVEGKKRKEEVETVREYGFDQIKWTKEYLDFK